MRFGGSFWRYCLISDVEIGGFRVGIYKRLFVGDLTRFLGVDGGAHCVYFVTFWAFRGGYCRSCVISGHVGLGIFCAYFFAGVYEGSVISV